MPRESTRLASGRPKEHPPRAKELLACSTEELPFFLADLSQMNAIREHESNFSPFRVTWRCHCSTEGRKPPWFRRSNTPLLSRNDETNREPTQGGRTARSADSATRPRRAPRNGAQEGDREGFFASLKMGMVSDED
jgi:hypothetical protein